MQNDWLLNFFHDATVDGKAPQARLVQPTNALGPPPETMRKTVFRLLV